MTQIFTYLQAHRHACLKLKMKIVTSFGMYFLGYCFIQHLATVYSNITWTVVAG